MDASTVYCNVKHNLTNINRRVDKILSKMLLRVEKKYTQKLGIKIKSQKY